MFLLLRDNNAKMILNLTNLSFGKITIKLLVNVLSEQITVKINLKVLDNEMLYVFSNNV